MAQDRLAGLAGPAASSAPSSLRLRIVSAAVLVPIALAASWLGTPYLPVLVAVAGAVMGWEWARLCGRGRLGIAGVAIIATISASVVAAALGAPRIALALILAGSLAVAWLQGRLGEPVAVAACGIWWIGVPCVALVWLGQDPGDGRLTVLWILAIVWATDIGAYVVGRTLGGPRLAPRMSPNKTWSGLLGGIACAIAAGGATSVIIGASIVSPLALLSGLLAIVEQSGDLAESAAKRHFGVKDSSGLIPGHGGLLDRLDGLLAVVPAVALLNLVGGSSVVTWR